jgi:hypothetical protein
MTDMHPTEDPHAERMRKLGRAVDDHVKYEMCQRLLNAWLKMPHQRLGQLVFNTLGRSDEPKPPIQVIEDEALVQSVEDFVEKWT